MALVFAERYLYLMGYLTISGSILNIRWNLGIWWWWQDLESVNSVSYSHITLMRKKDSAEYLWFVKIYLFEKKVWERGNEQPYLKRLGALIHSLTAML